MAGCLLSEPFLTSLRTVSGLAENEKRETGRGGGLGGGERAREAGKEADDIEA